MEKNINLHFSEIIMDNQVNEKITNNWIYEIKSIMSDNSHIRCFKIKPGIVRIDIDNNYYYELIFSFYYKESGKMIKKSSSIWIDNFYNIIKMDNQIWNRLEELVNIFINNEWILILERTFDDALSYNYLINNFLNCVNSGYMCAIKNKLLNNETDEKIFDMDEIIVDYYSNFYFKK